MRASSQKSNFQLRPNEGHVPVLETGLNLFSYYHKYYYIKLAIVNMFLSENHKYISLSNASLFKACKNVEI